MLRKTLGAVASVALLFAAGSATAQPAPTQTQRERGFFGSDEMVMLSAILLAGLVTLLATQVGGGGGDDEGEPVSP